jgi:NAD(P)-dependent dehydrogenase (short-subunit alcohol dehydrogenase family)
VQLDGMTFVITGAARGIGAATAALAASRGANVVVADVLDEAGAATVDAVRAAGGNAVFRHCDVSDADEVAALMEAAAAEYGGIDVLHNNAGIHETALVPDVSFDELPVDVFDRVLGVNLRGTFLCAKAAVPHLKRSTRGPSIVNAGSVASFVGAPRSLAYGTSKGAIALLTKNLAVALAPFGIRVNCYCPAAVETELVRAVNRAHGRDPALSQARKHLVNRLGRPEEIASLVCYLASEEAAFVNGAVWLIDGGSLAWRDTLDVLAM